MKKVLIVTAHPDDLEIGMGGTLLHLFALKFEVHSVVATLPVDTSQGEIRRQECIRSHALFGVQPSFWYQPDGALEVSRMTRALMESAYDKVSPDIVFTLWPADVHPDHRAIADIAMGPALQRGVNTELLCFEVCASGRNSVDFRPQSIGFFPTHYVDTSTVQTEKRALMDCHESQDPNGMWAGMRNVHKNRGFEDGTNFSEGFVRLTRFGEMCSELTAIFRRTPYSLPRGIGVDFKPETLGISP